MTLHCATAIKRTEHNATTRWSPVLGNMILAALVLKLSRNVSTLNTDDNIILWRRGLKLITNDLYWFLYGHSLTTGELCSFRKTCRTKNGPEMECNGVKKGITAALHFYTLRYHEYTFIFSFLNTYVRMGRTGVRTTSIKQTNIFTLYFILIYYFNRWFLLWNNNSLAQALLFSLILYSILHF